MDNSLLASIQKGKKLKHASTNDRSAPTVGNQRVVQQLIDSLLFKVVVWWRMERRNHRHLLHELLHQRRAHLGQSWLVHYLPVGCPN